MPLDPNRMIIRTNYILSVHEGKPEKLGIPFCHHGADDRLRPDPGLDDVSRANGVDPLGSPVGHRDRRLAHQAPRTVVLRPSQAVRFVGRVERGDGTGRPRDASLRRLVDGAGVRRADGQDARLALNHDVASIGGGRGNESQPLALLRLDFPADPLGSGAGLAESTAREDQPDEPLPAGRTLLVAGLASRAEPIIPLGVEAPGLTPSEFEFGPCLEVERWLVARHHRGLRRSIPTFRRAQVPCHRHDRTRIESPGCRP